MKNTFNIRVDNSLTITAGSLVDIWYNLICILEFLDKDGSLVITIENIFRIRSLTCALGFYNSVINFNANGVTEMDLDSIDEMVKIFCIENNIASKFVWLLSRIELRITEV